MKTKNEETRYSAPTLHDFSRRMLIAAGLGADQAQSVAEHMVDGDLLGHHTHGLWALRTYLDRLDGGHIAAVGEVEATSDWGSAISWNAHRAAGAWVMDEARALIFDRISTHPVISVSIADCSHIGCLQSYLSPYTDNGLLVQLTATNPGVTSVAAPGGTRPVITTNPMAMGIPTRTSPILIDQCTSVGSNALFEGFAARGERLPGEWLVDAHGQPTDDPTVLTQEPRGTIQSVGQSEFGYKGFGFGLMSEALSLAVSGYGRRNSPDRHGQAVFLQVMDPSKFGEGIEAFLDETDWLVAEVKDDPGRDGRRVRMPGERALRNRQTQLQAGVTIHPDAEERLTGWTEVLGISFPERLKSEEAVDADPGTANTGDRR